MSISKRIGWSESDVLALPSGESDYFDRKSGLGFTQNRGHFLDIIAKALSAFANSGGGHLILGLDDDGVTFDGLPTHEGRTPIREWLEQKIPHLLSYELQDFRVHEVTRDTPSTIAADKTVIVVDVGDSVLAPHQTASGGSRNYYYRPGGHSKIAPHHYLELLRQRVVGPQLTTTCTGITLENPYRINDGRIFLPFTIAFTVVNDGRVAAYKWQLYPREIEVPPGKTVEDFALGKSRFPAPQGDAATWSAMNRGGISLGRDDTILPGLDRSEANEVGVLLRLTTLSNYAEDFREASAIVQTVIKYRVATETFAGIDIAVALGDFVDADRLAAHLHSIQGLF